MLFGRKMSNVEILFRGFLGTASTMFLPLERLNKRICVKTAGKILRFMRKKRKSLPRDNVRF
jgi:hypothetical protein